MFDDKEGAAFGQAADQFNRAFGFGMAHTGGWFVEQDDIGTAGDGDADLQRTLFGIGEEASRNVTPCDQVDVL